MLLNKLLALTASLTRIHATSLTETLEKTPSLSILQDLLKQFRLLDTFNSASNVTLLAPTNEAYLALAKWGFNVSEVPTPVARALLSYHLLDGVHGSEIFAFGEEPTVIHSHLRPPVLTNVTDGAAVKLSLSNEGTIISESGLQVIGGTVQTDIHFTSGVLHTLNSSMVLPHNISVTAELNGLTKFLNAMEETGLVSEIEEQADVTVFLPSNAAMNQMQPLIDALQSSELKEVLRYHVVPGRVLYHHLVPEAAARFETLQGSPVTIHSDELSGFKVNKAQVVQSDLLIYGGVAHIVDELLIPSQGLLSSPKDISTHEHGWSLFGRVVDYPSPMSMLLLVVAFTLLSVRQWYRKRGSHAVWPMETMAKDPECV